MEKMNAGKIYLILFLLTVLMLVATHMLIHRDGSGEISQTMHYKVWA